MQKKLSKAVRKGTFSLKVIFSLHNDHGKFKWINTYRKYQNVAPTLELQKQRESDSNLLAV